MKAKNKRKMKKTVMKMVDIGEKNGENKRQKGGEEERNSILVARQEAYRFLPGPGGTGCRPSDGCSGPGKGRTYRPELWDHPVFCSIGYGKNDRSVNLSSHNWN
jgi:hypothetical protein